jgi:hypothetical protein
MTVRSATRLEERGRALADLLAAGASPGRLIPLDRRVREAALTDWPGRSTGQTERRVLPEPGWVEKRPR